MNPPLPKHFCHKKVLLIFVFLVMFRCDGGVCQNDYLVGLISDLTDCPIDRPENTDMTSLGAAFLAGLAQGQTFLCLVSKI